MQFVDMRLTHNKGNNHYIEEFTGDVSGKLHVFANEEVYKNLETRVFEMGRNNLQIPRNVHMSYTPDAHVGVGTCIGTTAVWNAKDGFISPSIVGSDIGCGMRLHRTNLHKNDLKDVELRRALVAGIEKYVNTVDESNFRKGSARQTVKGHYSESLDPWHIATKGLGGVPSEFFFNESDIENTEISGFDLEADIKAYLDKHGQGKLFNKDSKVFTSIRDQLGTLGGGNHFIEVQSIAIEDENRETAKKWGLFDGQIVFMVHSGSRGFGARAGRDAVKAFKEEMYNWGIESPDPNLVFAPFNSEVGQDYYTMLRASLNYAVANRHMIAYGVSQAFRDVMGEHVETELLYDLMHNYAQVEFHRNSPHIVHRKGATRALPAGHYLNPKAFKETGHPALIPGSMGTSSYIMLGKDEGVKNFYSICHGAGRVRSRRATREVVTVDDFAKSLRVGEDDEIVVNQKSLETILDECPQAYKDVDQIIDSVVGAKLASVVAVCKPLVVVKGA
ncbi:RNA-splicing ligase [Bacillus phage vB_BsuM-Goe26]|nr:RNA-splicing ligase [Bacillus phage vB_BsuM-Goe26]